MTRHFQKWVPIAKAFMKMVKQTKFQNRRVCIEICSLCLIAVGAHGEKKRDFKHVRITKISINRSKINRAINIKITSV